MTLAHIVQLLCIVLFTIISLGGLPFFIIFFFMLLLKGLHSETVQRVYFYAIMYLMCFSIWIVMIFTL